MIVQDIEIERNEHVTGLKAKLPNRDIRKLALQECQICYADGTVVSYDGENELSFEVEEFDDLESKAAIKKYMGKKQNIR